MSVAAAQSAAFFKEIIAESAVWTIRDEGGFPAPMNGEKRRVQPFWSKEKRAKRIIETVPAYSGFVTHRLSLSDFKAAWLPGLSRDGLLVGLNWSGKRAVGYDFEPTEVCERLSSA
jgi:hypothetical protein